MSFRPEVETFYDLHGEDGWRRSPFTSVQDNNRVLLSFRAIARNLLRAIGL